jgi:hypothetical protein
MHADHCRGVRSKFLTYKLPPMTVGLIKVCCTQFGGDGCGADLLKAVYVVVTFSARSLDVVLGGGGGIAEL